MSQSSFDRLLKKYLSGECTEEEEKIIIEWYQQLIEKTDLHLSDEEKAQIESRLWNTIKANIQATDDEPKVVGKVIPVRSRSSFWKVAAGIVLILGIGTMIYYRNHARNGNRSISQINVQQGYSKFTNEADVEKKLVLSDSTVILLQPKTSVYYPPVFTGYTREIYLTGSAFFKVHHNPLRHFMVHMSGDLTTEVLGTSFNIIQREASDKIEVQVVTGKVCVYQQQKKNDVAGNETAGRIILTPNKKVIFNAVNHQFTTGLVDDPQPLENLKNKGTADTNRHGDPFLFEDEELDTVLETLSRSYGIHIIAENEKLGHYHFTGNISKYDLHKKLDIICQSTQSIYEVNGTEIVLREK